MRDIFLPCVYILASRRHGTLYVGVTSNLLARIVQHRKGLIPGFTKAYGVRHLTWYEPCDTMESAILRERRIKEWRRAWKIALIRAKRALGRSGDRTGAAAPRLRRCGSDT